MDDTGFELILLAVFSALLCGTALVMGHPVGTAIFGAFASTITVISVGL